MNKFFGLLALVAVIGFYPVSYAADPPFTANFSNAAEVTDAPDGRHAKITGKECEFDRAGDNQQCVAWSGKQYESVCCRVRVAKSYASLYGKNCKVTSTIMKGSVPIGWEISVPAPGSEKPTAADSCLFGSTVLKITLPTL